MSGRAGNSSNLTPAVVCLAAGKSQLVVVKKATELGYAVIAVDRNPQATAFPLCTERIVASTYEAKPIISRLHTLQKSYELVGVINRSSGYPVISSAKICAAFNLPGPSPKSAEILTNKSLLMDACHRSGIAAPRFQSISSFEQLDHSKIEYPCVVKPAISLVGKSGIRVVDEPTVLPAAFAEALKISLNGLVNVEEFVPGRDLSLLAFVEKGEIHPIVLRDELNSVMPDGRIRFNGIAIPSLFSGEAEEAKVLELARQVTDTFKLDRTAINLSCRCEPGGTPTLIEVHLDIGGDQFFEGLLPESTSADILGLMIGFLTGSLDQMPDFEFKPAALLFEPGGKPGLDRSFSVIRAENKRELGVLVVRFLEDVGSG